MNETFVFTDYAVFNSTALRRAWYNKNTLRLIVQFTGSGNYAGYANVTPQEWAALNSAASAGSYYANFLKTSKSGFSTPSNLIFERHFEPKAEAQAKPVTYKVTARVSAETSVDVPAGNIQEAIDAFVKRLTEGLGDSVEIDIKGVVRN